MGSHRSQSRDYHLPQYENRGRSHHQELLRSREQSKERYSNYPYPPSNNSSSRNQSTGRYEHSSHERYLQNNPNFLYPEEQNSRTLRTKSLNRHASNPTAAPIYARDNSFHGYENQQRQHRAVSRDHSQRLTRPNYRDKSEELRIRESRVLSHSPASRGLLSNSGSNKNLKELEFQKYRAYDKPKGPLSTEELLQIDHWSKLTRECNNLEMKLSKPGI